MAFLFSTSSCALAFSYRSQVELGRKVGITYTMSSHGLQLALVWLNCDWATSIALQNWRRAFCTEGAFIILVLVAF